MGSVDGHGAPRPPLPVVAAVTALVLGWIAATVNSLLNDLGSVIESFLPTVIMAILIVGLWRGQRGAWFLSLVVSALNAAVGLMGWLGLTDRIDHGIAGLLRLTVALVVAALVTVPADARAYLRRDRRPAARAG